MRNKIILLCLFGIGALAVMVGFLRKELPYHFDFVRTKDGVAIINSDSWNARPLIVKVKQNGTLLARGTIDPESDSGIITDVNPVGKATIEISRGDLLGKIRYKRLETEYDFDGKAQSYVVLVGASIGKAWDLGNLPERINDQSVSFGSRALYQFDKTEGIIPLTKLEHKPKAVIIKQCSIYFPRNTESSASMLKGWVEILKKSDIEIVLATTTPVAKDEPVEGQQEAIDQWNKFIRNYARKAQLPVLDLAKALQASWLDTHLKPGYYQDDGYHLKPVAYKDVMDPILQEFVNKQIL